MVQLLPGPHVSNPAFLAVDGDLHVFPAASRPQCPVIISLLFELEGHSALHEIIWV